MSVASREDPGLSSVRSRARVWSPDGRPIAFNATRTDGRGGGAEWLEDGTVVFFSRSQPGAQSDGTMMAYSSNETGQTHVFIRGFPDMGGRWQVSDRPAYGPLLRARDGRAVFYHGRDR
jgi:hypothetical protein